MKNAEGVALASDLDRRLKASIDQLRDVRETLEQLGRSAGALQRLVGVEEVQELVKAKDGRSPKGKMTPPPPAPSARPAPSSPPPKPAPEEDIPEWRKVFPTLSSKVPGRGK